MRIWQEMGWSIAIHGYQHKYQSEDAGILGLNRYSEFSGLSYSLQQNYLSKGLAIFEANGVRSLWIARHSFDETTIKILRESGIKII